MLMVVVMNSNNSRNSSHGGEEPERKVALTVGVDVDKGAAIKGIVGLSVGDVSTEQGLGLLVADGGGRGCVGCSVVRHECESVRK